MVAVPSIGRASGVAPSRAPREAEATRELYERYAGPIYAYCFRQLGSKEEAEDATQSTFLNAFRGYIRGVDPEYESAWIYKIAENVCLTRQRSSSRRRRVEAASDLDAMQDFVPAHQADSDELIRLPEALDAMPEHQRRALLLREWQGLSYKEIAEELHLSQAAVETLLFRARRSLAAGLVDEPQQKKSLAKRTRAGDLGSLVTLVKSILFTGGAKAVATVATVAATSVVAATPAARHAVEHVVSPVPSPAKHHVTKRPSVAPSAGAPHVAVAGAAAVVAHHAKPGRRVALTRAHQALAKHAKAPRLATSVGPVHASSISHVQAGTTEDPTTATAATPTPVADPAPTPSAQPTPTTSSSPPPTTQSTPTATPPPSTSPTTKDKDTAPSTKDNGTSTSSGNSNGNGKSTTLTLSPTQPTPVETPGTTTTPPTTQPAPSGNNGNGNGNANGQDKGKTSKTVVQNPTTTLAPPTTQPSTTPAPAPAPAPAPTPAPAPSITLAPATTATPVATPLPESPGTANGHKK